jgi:hypothetical protein
MPSRNQHATDPVEILLGGRPWWKFGDGVVIPVISGGQDPDPDPKPDPDPDPDPKPDPKPDPEPKPDPDPEGLGDAGKRALAAEREARKAAEKRAKDAEIERDRLKQASESEQEKAVREAAEEARTEERTKANLRILRAEVKARAGTKLADPDDAVRLLDLDALEISDDGEVDTEKIDKAIERLLKAKPYLAPGAKPGGKTSVDGGARPDNGDPKVDQKTRLERIQQRTGIR